MPRFPSCFHNHESCQRWNAILLAVESYMAEYLGKYTRRRLSIHQFREAVVSYRLTIRGVADQYLPRLNGTRWPLRRWIEFLHGRIVLATNATVSSSLYPE